MKKLSINLTNVATLGPVGHLPKAPGTWGSAAALITAPFLFLPFHLPVRILILGLILYVGAKACTAAEKQFEKKDPSCVVIDEVLGQWLVFLPFPAVVDWHLVVGFILFRIFDIYKPFPVKQSEKWFKAGWGVMIDDVFAGLYAMIGLGIIRYIT